VWENKDIKQAIKTPPKKPKGRAKPFLLSPLGKTLLVVLILGVTLGTVGFTYYYVKYSRLIDQKSLWGPNGNTTSFVLVFSIALAITSIPVISRIMHDIGILDTAFARIVLGVAVLEDLVLYVVLAVAIGYAGGTGNTLFGLPSALGITGGSNQDLIYHVLMTLAFLAVFLVAGPPAYRWIGNLEINVIQRATPSFSGSSVSRSPEGAGRTPVACATADISMRPTSENYRPFAGHAACYPRGRGSHANTR